MKLGVTGHRPDKIGGYDERHPLRVAVRAAIRAEVARQVEIASKVGLGEQLVGITGMALGVDTDFAEVCVELAEFEPRADAW